MMYLLRRNSVILMLVSCAGGVVARNHPEQAEGSWRVRRRRRPGSAADAHASAGSDQLRECTATPVGPWPVSRMRQLGRRMPNLRRRPMPEHSSVIVSIILSPSSDNCHHQDAQSAGVVTYSLSSWHMPAVLLRVEDFAPQVLTRSGLGSVLRTCILDSSL